MPFAKEEEIGREKPPRSLDKREICPSIQVDHVDFDAYAERDRWNLWSDIAAPFFDVERNDSEAPFRGRVTTLSFGEIIVVKSRLPGQRYTRDAARARVGPWDQVAFQLYCSGSFAGDYDGSEVVSGRDDINVIDLARPYAKTTTDEIDINLILPRAMAASLSPSASHGVKRTGATSAGRLLGLHLRMLVASATQLTVEEAEGVVRGFLLLIEGTDLNDVGPATKAGLKATARTRTEGFIRDNLLRSDLDATAVARGCGLSRASLYRLFSTDGGVHNFIQQKRLSLALDRMRLHPDASLDELSETSGLGGRSELERLLRRSRGQSLSDVRHLFRQAGRAATAQSTPEGWLSTLRRMREIA